MVRDSDSHDCSMKVCQYKQDFGYFCLISETMSSEEEMDSSQTRRGNLAQQEALVAVTVPDQPLFGKNII